jgi:hypothetical protein
VLALPGTLQLVLDRRLGCGLNVGGLYLVAHRIDVCVAYAAAHGRLQPALDYLSKTPQLFANRLGLAHEDLKNPVLRALEIDEVVTEHLVTRLKLAVDATVALLHARRVPRNVEVKQVPAVGLEIETLARRIGRNENAHRV